MTRDEQEHYDCFAKRRATLTLPTGMRWLTQDDHWQLGDEYLASKDWWAIGGPHTSWPVGGRVPWDVICYTPRGLIKRGKTT